MEEQVHRLFDYRRQSLITAQQLNQKGINMGIGQQAIGGGSGSVEDILKDAEKIYQYLVKDLP